MKREYKKPEIAVESFQLNAAIAGSCADDGKIPINQSVSMCELSDGDILPFGMSCDGYDVMDTDQSQEFCYHEFLSDAKAVFLES